MIEGGKIETIPLKKHQDNVKQIKHKMKILKQAVKVERQSNSQLEDELFLTIEKVKKKEIDSKRRQDKNQALLLEIRVLRDALIAEKNQRQELQSRLQQLKDGKNSSGSGLLSASNYFGLKSLFQK